MINSTNSDLNLASLAAPASASGAKKSSTLDQDTFLQLMITQFRNQDPFKPLDPTQFLGQLAQFSSVSSLSEMSKSVGKLSDALYANQTLQASSLIGRTVLVSGNTGTLSADQPLAGAVELPAASASATVRIYNDGGELVRQLPLGPREGGLNRFKWDGITSAGTTALPGHYRFEAVISDGTGETALTTYESVKVTSITLSSDLAGSRITTESGEELRLADVKNIQ